MKVIVGDMAGFCYGVDRAVSTTVQELKEKQNKKIYCLGELVHNKQVIERLERQNAKTVENLDEIEECKDVEIIIRAHGVPPDIYKKIEDKQFELLDLTCPNVLAIHKLAEKASKEDKYVFLIGHKGHPEVEGIYGCCKQGFIIETEEDITQAIQELKNSSKKNLLILSQTTFSFEKFNNYVEEIKGKLKDVLEECEIEVRRTICNATKLRQEETEKISKEVQYMIIIGGKNSSNTKKLYDIAHKNCKNSICIETVAELKIEEINTIKSEIKEKNQEFKIGIMAGASTPKESIEDVKKITDMM